MIVSWLGVYLIDMWGGVRGVVRLVISGCVSDDMGERVWFI